MVMLEGAPNGESPSGIWGVERIIRLEYLDRNPNGTSLPRTKSRPTSYPGDLQSFIDSDWAVISLIPLHGG